MRPPPQGVRLDLLYREQLDDGFFDSAVRVLDRAFNGWPGLDLPVSPGEHLRWKVESPTPGFPAVLIAEATGELVALRVLLVRHVLVRGERRLFLHFVDAAVDPDWQGRGINGAMQDVMLYQFQPTFDLSIDDSENRTILRSRTRLGTIESFGNRVAPFALVLDAAGLQRGVARNLPLPLLDVANRVLTAGIRSSAQLHGRAPSIAGLTLESVDQVGAEFGAFLKGAMAPYEFVPERTPEWINWRYADPRAGDFALRIARRDGKLVGYAATKLTRNAANLADLLTLPDEPGAAHLLVADAVAEARAADAEVISCWLPVRHPYRRALRSAGFAAFHRRTPLMYRAASMPEAELAFLRSASTPIHLTQGDTDMV